MSEGRRELVGRKARPDLPEACPRYSHVRRAGGNRRQKARSMKKNDKKVLPFPPPPPGSTDQTVICQIGRERFAIHFEFEDLPPAAPTPRPPLLLLQPPTRERKCVE